MGRKRIYTDEPHQRKIELYNKRTNDAAKSLINEYRPVYEALGFNIDKIEPGTIAKLEKKLVRELVEMICEKNNIEKPKFRFS